MWKELAAREAGRLSPNSFARRITSTRASSINLSNQKEFVSPHKGSVNSLHVDSSEGRYLLSGAADASVAVFDIQAATEYEGGGLIAQHKPLFVVDKQHQSSSHQYAISSAIWYPVDTGLFITGSYDHLVNVWDTNTIQVVMDFKMSGKVYKTAMSPVAGSHMLIAAGTEEVDVRLCDIASGAFTHTLLGHRGGVMAIEWSISSEWVLMTGGCDGAIRFWDIRRAGSFQVLDQSKTQLGRRPPVMRRNDLQKASPISNSSSLSGPSSAKSGSKSHNRQTNAATKQRLHPGLVSAHDHTTAHYGVVTGLKAVEDGMYLLSAGSDSRLRLWDIESGCNTLVNYETATLQGMKPLQLAMTRDSALVFVPCLASVKSFEVWSGSTTHRLRGHYEHVNCCCYNSENQELYTGGNDRQILVWSPQSFAADEVVVDGKGKYTMQDRDYWSD